MKFKVRTGYTLHLPGGKVFAGGDEVNVDPVAVKGQEWKVEAVKPAKASKAAPEKRS